MFVRSHLPSRFRFDVRCDRSATVAKRGQAIMKEQARNRNVSVALLVAHSHANYCAPLSLEFSPSYTRTILGPPSESQVELGLPTKERRRKKKQICSTNGAVLPSSFHQGTLASAVVDMGHRATTWLRTTHYTNLMQHQKENKHQCRSTHATRGNILR